MATATITKFLKAFYGCIDVSWGKAGAAYLFSGSNEVKVW